MDERYSRWYLVVLHARRSLVTFRPSNRTELPGTTMTTWVGTPAGRPWTGAWQSFLHNLGSLCAAAAATAASLPLQVCKAFAVLREVFPQGPLHPSSHHPLSACHPIPQLRFQAHSHSFITSLGDRVTSIHYQPTTVSVPIRLLLASRSAVEVLEVDSWRAVPR